MTFAALPAEKAGLAGGLILGAAGVGNAAGPLIGEVLDDIASWRWIFYLNLPVTAFAVAVTTKFIHQPRTQTEDTQLDYWGVVTITVGLVALLLALDQVPEGGGAIRILGLMALFDQDRAFVPSTPPAEARAGAAGRHTRPWLRPPPCAAVLLHLSCFRDAVPAAVHVEGARLHSDQTGARMLPMMACSPQSHHSSPGLCTTASDRSCSPRSARPASPRPLLIALVAADESYSAIVSSALSSPALVSASSTRRSPPPE